MTSLWPSQIGPNRSPMIRISVWPIDTIANSASSDNTFTLLVLYLGEWKWGSLFMFKSMKLIESHFSDRSAS
eukprot:scaffold17340_cov74-Skeletonema_dohrnii-CCMP3373.AAC.2